MMEGSTGEGEGEEEGKVMEDRDVRGVVGIMEEVKYPKYSYNYTHFLYIHFFFMLFF